MFSWATVGNYTITILLTVGVIMMIFHFATKGRIWSAFSSDKYKCGMVQMLSVNETPDVTGLFATQQDAADAVLKCNAPQAFTYDHHLCTLHEGKYGCIPSPTTMTT